jgi:hypothetical protein
MTQIELIDTNLKSFIYKFKMIIYDQFFAQEFE